jgi:PAS domain S-box-containing protein
MSTRPMEKTPPAQAASVRLPAACADFLKTLGHAVQLVALYDPAHLVAAAALRECWLTASALLESESPGKLTLALVDGRWVAGGIAFADESQCPDALRKLLRRHAVRSLSLAAGVKMYELAAFCELASTAPQAAEWENAGEFLALRGVSRLAVNRETFTASAEPAPPPPAGPEPAPAASPRRSFSGLLRGLVEDSVQNEEERAHLYEEALGLVKEALDRQVAAETARLQLEKQRVLGEQLRTEQVLSAVAEGKVTVDQDGKIMNMNPAAERISGSRLTEVAGKPLTESLAGGERIVALAAGPEDRGETATPGVRLTADAEVRRAFGSSIALVQDLNGRVIGTCAVLPDAAKLKELQKFEEDLLSRVTHELKAPLTALCAALEIVTDKAGGRLDEETTRFLESCRRNTDRLQKTINDILSFSQLRAGRMDVVPISQPVEPVLREAVESLTPWARKRNIVLSAGAVPPGLAPVLADRKRLLQIVNNLVSNAIKSTPDGGRVTLSAEAGTGPRAGCVQFAVRDTGCGIPERDQKRIFQEFVRVNDPVHSCEGIGLGLAIVRELVDRHGGTVWVESREGKGSAFYFTIPCARAGGK